MEYNELLGQIAVMMEQNAVEIKVFIENTVTKRLDALTDGYKLAQEKQWELEQKAERLSAQVEELQNRLAVLEGKSA